MCACLNNFYCIFSCYPPPTWHGLMYNCQTKKLKSVYGPYWGPGTKTNWPTDCRLQCNLKLNLRHCIANYRPVLSSERAPYMKNKESNRHSKKCNIRSPTPKEARHQDELVDWLSVVMWLRLRHPTMKLSFPSPSPMETDQYPKRPKCRWTKFKNWLILSVIHHRQKPLGFSLKVAKYSNISTAVSLAVIYWVTISSG
jgi:hypothetical protein